MIDTDNASWASNLNMGKGAWCLTILVYFLFLIKRWDLAPILYGNDLIGGRTEQRDHY
jgi:hypothetical protein